MNTEISLPLQKNFLSKTGTPCFLPYFICGLAALFHLYQFALQVSPAVMTSELMRDLHLNASGLGILAACYYYAYTPMQIPAGMFFDRYSARVLITIAVLICSLGGFFFGLTHNIFLTSTGRFLMGIGSAFSFIGSLVLVSRWFPAKYFALLTGIVQLMCSIGAILGEAPLAKAVDSYGWQHTILFISFIGLILALLVWIIVRDQPKTQQTIEKKPTSTAANKLTLLKTVCSRSQTWWIAVYSFTSWVPITAFAALWGIPCLMTLYGMNITTASTACSMIWLGVGLGSPLVGWFSDKIGQRCLPLFISSMIGFFSLSLILYATHLSLFLIYLMLFLFGVGASGQALSFGLVKDQNSPHIIGTAIGFNNMAVVAGASLFQPLIGYLLDWNWQGKLLGGVHIYSIENYRLALCTLPICFLVGGIISKFLLRETYCINKNVLQNELVSR